MANVISWFEIPARDVDRAIKFYSDVLGVTFERYNGSAFFGHGDETGVGGEVSPGEPSSTGVLVYLLAPRGVEDALERVEAAGGKVLTPRTSIGEHGWIAVVQDTEGNRIGLHNMSG